MKASKRIITNETQAKGNIKLQNVVKGNQQ